MGHKELITLETMKTRISKNSIWGQKMKRFSILVTILFLIFAGCENTTNLSPVGPDSVSLHSDAIITDSTSTINVPVMEYTILVNGQNGGTYNFNPSYFDGTDSITASISLTFPSDKNELPAFEGTKIFKVIVDMEKAAMQFIDVGSPDGHITFDNKVKLSAKFDGVNPSILGLIPNLKVDFVYIADDGSIELIKNNGVVYKNNGSHHSSVSVNNAELIHFSRYCWAT
jgi:hypothetical protein